MAAGRNKGHPLYSHSCNWAENSLEEGFFPSVWRALAGRKSDYAR